MPVHTDMVQHIAGAHGPVSSAFARERIEPKNTPLCAPPKAITVYGEAHTEFSCESVSGLTVVSFYLRISWESARVEPGGGILKFPAFGAYLFLQGRLVVR